MNYWLLKSEPSAWSWDDQVRAKTTDWEGVRNYQAANHLKAMQRGDQAFFYHSNEGKEIVGIVEISKTAFPDASDDKGRFVAVEIKTKRKLKHPVTLAAIKNEAPLQEMALLKQSRLSVSPVTADEWQYILELSSTAK